MSVFGSELYGSGDAIPFALELIGNFEGCGTAEGFSPVFDDKKLGAGRLLALVPVRPRGNVDAVGGCIKLLQIVDLIHPNERVCIIAVYNELATRWRDYSNSLKCHVSNVLVLDSKPIKSAARACYCIFFNVDCRLQVPQNEICLHSQIVQLSEENNDRSYADNGRSPTTGRTVPFLECRFSIANNRSGDKSQKGRTKTQQNHVSPKALYCLHVISPKYNCNLVCSSRESNREAA